MDKKTDFYYTADLHAKQITFIMKYFHVKRQYPKCIPKFYHHIWLQSPTVYKYHHLIKPSKWEET